jgi:hypothetical protein
MCVWGGGGRPAVAGHDQVGGEEWGCRGCGVCPAMPPAVLCLLFPSSSPPMLLAVLHSHTPIPLLLPPPLCQPPQAHGVRLLRHPPHDQGSGGRLHPRPHRPPSPGALEKPAGTPRPHRPADERERRIWIWIWIWGARSCWGRWGRDLSCWGRFGDDAQIWIWVSGAGEAELFWSRHSSSSSSSSRWP